MIDQIQAARDAALARAAAVGSLTDAEALEGELLGKKGPFASFRTQLGALATVDEKKAAGQAVNEAVDSVRAALDERQSA